ncbi:hypothetical protein EXIGLDRAFT_427044 [Exidia glandulosa HHB12029]|uniref:Uncharacterized protein n=1 Tax=Exidia glandulosa HHB12029 TaxID=1314781 RepID=A0A165BC51_EXIGL|nr:hypothetical protein EXIGLDRAFT_427044 [Exidia glandulosa HHB12029]
MYDGHVQAGVKKLLGLGQFSAGDTNQAALQKAAADIQTWANGASQGIQDLIKAEQDKMESDVQTRLDEMSQALAGILPPPSSSIKKVIEDATQAHVVEVSEALTTAQNNKPVWQPKLGMTL